MWGKIEFLVGGLGLGNDLNSVGRLRLESMKLLTKILVRVLGC